MYVNSLPQHQVLQGSHDQYHITVISKLTSFLTQVCHPGCYPTSVYPFLALTSCHHRHDEFGASKDDVMRHWELCNRDRLITV